MKLRALKACSLVTATGIVLLAGCSHDDSAGSKAPANLQHSKSSTTTYEVGVASQLSVDTTAGDVHIVASDRSDLKVTEKITYSADKPRTSHTSRDGKVMLKDHDCRSGSCSVSYRIMVPERLSSRISSGGGNISGSALAGNTVAETKGGDVNLAFAKAPADLDAFSAGGDVDIRVPAGHYAVQAQANGGDRKVGVTVDKGSVHKVKARSNGGDVTVVPR